jgi:uncharacterized SAM-binding protein YcdF (DUF218 family)
MVSVAFKFRKLTTNVLFNPVIWVYWLAIALMILFGTSFYFVFFSMVLFVILFNFLPYFLIKKLESNYGMPQKKLQHGFSHYLVLGGGHNPDSAVVVEQQLNNSSLRRVLEGVRLFNLNSNAVLIMSGAALKQGHLSQAEIQEKVAITMGVNKKNIEIIPEPNNTVEEVVFYHRKFGFHDTPVFLITKALHMKRALFIFSSFGYHLIPSPAYAVHRNFKPNITWFFAPEFQLIIHFGEYIKEYVGYNILKIQILLKLKTLNPVKAFAGKTFRTSSFEMINR